MQRSRQQSACYRARHTRHSPTGTPHYSYTSHYALCTLAITPAGLTIATGTTKRQQPISAISAGSTRESYSCTVPDSPRQSKRLQPASALHTLSHTPVVQTPPDSRTLNNHSHTRGGSTLHDSSSKTTQHDSSHPCSSMSPTPVEATQGHRHALTATRSSTHPEPSTSRDDFGPPAWAPQPLVNFMRSSEFFTRVVHIYGAYKVTQLRAAVLRAQGRTQQEIKEQLWVHQHTWAGQQMYDLCISLRGFYLKAGQFIGARADFVPEQICRKLCLLQDKVPPMSPERAKQVVCAELGLEDLSEVFEWINLEEPIGSASISQVHKAQLRRFRPEQLRHLQRQESGLLSTLTVAEGDTAWGVCNSHGISLAELAAVNRDVDLDQLNAGQVLKVPVVLGLEHFKKQQQQQHVAASGGWFGLGRLLTQPVHLHSNSTDGGGSNSSSRRASTAEDEHAWPSRSSGNSSSDDWFETGSSLLAASSSGGNSSSDQQPWLRPHNKQHLLELVTGGRSNGSSNGFSPGLFSGMLGTCDSETEDGGNYRFRSSSSSDSGGQLPGVNSPAAAAVAHAAAAGHVPDRGLVAVKVQYPGALKTMTLDLVNLRSVSAFLQKTELKFDLVSAVDELQRQIHLEFDFMREARVMDTIAQHLTPLSHKVAVPRSVPGLVTQRLMVMSFMEGTPLMQLRDKVAHLPKWKRDKAARRILSQVSQAYGLMILGEGLFQADGHPGNILVQDGGRVALLDYGQSKQLEETDKLAFADLVLAMHRGDKQGISDALWRLRVSTSSGDINLRSDMAHGMFDTIGKTDPFDKNSPIKKAAIEKFPPDMFFVLRVVQLLRGMATGMGIDDFSSADLWAPLAKQAVCKAQRRAQRRRAAATWRAQPMFDLAALASPLRLNV